MLIPCLPANEAPAKSVAPTSLATDKERLQNVLYISEVDGTPKSLIYQSRAKKCQMAHKKKKSGNRIALKMLLYLGLCSECQILEAKLHFMGTCCFYMFKKVDKNINN